MTPRDRVLAAIDTIKAELRERLAELTAAGPVLEPGDRGYAEEVASYSLTFRAAPAVVVGATTAADLAPAGADRPPLRRHQPGPRLVVKERPSVVADAQLLGVLERLDRRILAAAPPPPRGAVPPSPPPRKPATATISPGA